MGGMGTIEYVNYLLNMLLTGSLIATLLVGGLAYYLLKVKKVMAKEEKIDYSKFERTDTDEFAKFDNIIDISTGRENETFGVMVVNNRTFLGMIEVKGYNFHTASVEDRLQTITNSVGFFNMVENPIQLRQTSKAIDISYNIQEQEKKCQELEYRLIELDGEYKDTVDLWEIHAAEENKEIIDSIEERILSLQREIRTTKWLLEEAQEVLHYLKSITVMGNPTKVNHLIFSYTYNPNDYVEELTEEEIYLKASHELATLGTNYSLGLSNCGCHCRLMPGREMMDLIRRHFHPKTGDEVRVSDLFGSSFQSLFITSDDILSMARKKMGEKKFQRELKRLENEYGHKEEHYKETLEKYVTDIKDKVEEKVMQEYASSR